MRHLLGLLLVALTLQTDPWQSIARVLGHGGRLAPDGSYRVSIARSDLQVQNSSGMLLPPEIGLVSELKFKQSGEGVEVSGDLCVVQSEIDPVIDDLRSARLEIVALSNRFAGEQPAVYFASFRGKGEAAAVARELKKVLGEMGARRLVNEGLLRTGSVPVVDWKAVSLVLGSPVREISASHVWEARPEEPSWVRFGGCPCGRTMMVASISVGRERLQQTIDSARRRGLSITAITGSDSLAELYLEGEGEAVTLAKSMRDVLADRSR